MKRMPVGLLSAILSVCMVAALLLPVCAEENSYDWDSVDWETYDWRALDTGDVRRSLTDWLKTGASLEKLFDADRSCTHIPFRESFWDIQYMRFAKAPEKFLITLAKEDAAFQDHIIFTLCIAMSFPENAEECIDVLERIRLSNKKNPEAVALMLKLILNVEEELGISITIPRTGDPVGAAAAALLLSGCGIAVLQKKKWV